MLANPQGCVQDVRATAIVQSREPETAGKDCRLRRHPIRRKLRGRRHFIGDAIRRDPFRVDIGVGRSVRQRLHRELAHTTEMERIACRAGASF